MFLNPLLLFGIAGVSVPIIIHLLNRRKFEHVVWAAMRFIQVAVEQNQRRMQVEDWLLLACRCLLIGLLALALARPAISGAAGMFGATRVTAVVLLDNSASMSAIDGGTSKFEHGKKIADQVIGALPSGSSVSVMLASDVAIPVIAQPTYDLVTARNAIAKSSLSDRASNLLPPIQKAIETLNTQSALRKEIYLISDAQGLGWRQTGDIQKMLQDVRKDIQATVVIVGEPETRNLGVSDLRLASAMAPVNQPLRFEAQVTNYGLAEVRAVPVKLSVDGEPASEETTIDSIAPGAAKSVSMFIRFKTDGPHAVTARLPRDNVPADDERTIVVRAIKQVQVLIVDGDPGREPRDSKAYFLREALQPVNPTLREQYFIQVKAVTTSDLEQTRLDEFDAVILANVTDLSPALVGGLERFVKDGGGLVVFPGANANVAFYNDQLFRKNRLLPAELGPSVSDATQGAKFLTFQSGGYEHAIVSLWGETGVGMMTSARFYRVFSLADGAAARMPEMAKTVDIGSSRVVVRYSNGSPAIMERPWGLGRVILFSSGADTAWNDLPARAKVFVPLMNRVLGSLLSRQDDTMNVPVGRKFILRLPSDFLGKDTLISRMGGEKVAPDARRVEMLGNSPALAYDKTDVAAAYTAQIVGEATSFRFATQADPAESRIEPVSQEQLKAIANAAAVVRWKQGTAVGEAMKKERIGTELWLPIALAVLALATAETLMAHWFSKTK